MKLINKTDKGLVIKFGSKWIYFDKGQVKEGFPEDFFKTYPKYSESLSEFDSESKKDKEVKTNGSNKKKPNNRHKW